MPTAWPAKTWLKLIFLRPRLDGFVVEGIVDVRQSLVRASGRLIDFGGTLHAQGFVRTLVIEDR
jgi:hypothetical protein